MGAHVTALDRSPAVLERLEKRFGPKIRSTYSTGSTIEEAVVAADLVIGAVLIPGAAAPKLVTEDMVKAMRPGAVVVDVAIDQGGSIATSRATTHSDPTYLIYDVVHYCVANMPGAVPNTSTYALNNATLPFTLAIASKGARQACLDDEHLRNGLNVFDGKLTEPSVADVFDLDYTDALTALG